MNYITLLILSFSIGFSAGMPLANAEPLDHQSPTVVPMTMAHMDDAVFTQAGYDDFIAPAFPAEEPINLDGVNPAVSPDPAVEASFQDSVFNVSAGTPDKINYTPSRTEE